MNFNSVRIVLVATTHPGNIGATARAMKTMGFSRLYLVTPKIFPDLRANEMAAGADDILANCVVVDSLDNALQGCHLAIATSARPRDLALEGLTTTELADMVARNSDSSEIAIVFGREHAGLTNEELLRCNYHVNIPSNPEYSSLNLAQAVQIIVYELRMKLLSPAGQVACRQEPQADIEEIERFYQHLAEVLKEINFLKPENGKRLQQRLRRLFNRARLEQMEVNILRGILSHMQNALKWAARSNRSQDHE
ncbi:RNA methyltransferase [Legionella dresdenensis]|uniref:tRNA (cytidine/uridine-2'-O-)-methyltransferase TrmJ n=1 Tax=Legionella dresdenensis TaxID=450200 RepID=A0ABV8CCC8_9GAMM